MAQQLRELAVLVQDLSLAPSTHIRQTPVAPIPGDSQAPVHELTQANTQTQK